MTDKFGINLFTERIDSENYGSGSCHQLTSKTCKVNLLRYNSIAVDGIVSSMYSGNRRTSEGRWMFQLIDDDEPTKTYYDCNWGRTLCLDCSGRISTDSIYTDSCKLLKHKKVSPNPPRFI